MSIPDGRDVTAWSDRLDGTFEAVLFDMDGTLIDSGAAVERSWERWAREYAVPWDGIRHGVPARQILAPLLPAGQHEAALARIEQIEVEDVEGIVVLPGAGQALAALAAHPERAAIVTSCTALLAWARIEATGLPHPDVVVTASDVTRGKPDPEPFLVGAARLGVDPARCLVVEDAPAGLAAARAAGCATLAVTTTHDAGELAAAGADGVVATLAAVTVVSGPAGVGVRRAPGDGPGPLAPTLDA